MQALGLFTAKGFAVVADAENNQVEERRWITLGLARTLLGINEATLRQWADNGLVRAFRTPGGHRRFSADDIYALIEEGQAGRVSGMHVDGSLVLPRLRRFVKGETRPPVPGWMGRFDEDGHRRMRTLGRGFLDLCLDFIEHPGNMETLRAAATLGTTYGAEIASRGIPLTDALQAFFFFRNATMEAIKPTMTRGGANGQEVATAFEQLTKLTDQVLLGLTAYYRQEPLGQSPFASTTPGQSPTGAQTRR